MASVIETRCFGFILISNLSNIFDTIQKIINNITKSIVHIPCITLELSRWQSLPERSEELQAPDILLQRFVICQPITIATKLVNLIIK
jgi:hypothetical protein